MAEKESKKYVTLHIYPETRDRVTSYCQILNLTRDELLNWMMDELKDVYKKALEEKLKA